MILIAVGIITLAVVYVLVLYYLYKAYQRWLKNKDIDLETKREDRNHERKINENRSYFDSRRDKSRSSL